MDTGRPRTGAFPQADRSELARRLNSNPSHISRVLSGAVRGSYALLEDLADELGVKREHLLARIREARRERQERQNGKPNGKATQKAKETKETKETK